MRIILFLSVLSDIPSLYARGFTPSSPVGVYLEFKELPSKIAVDSMQKEVSDLLRPMGIKIAWRLVSENRGNETFTQLAVATFTGECSCGNFLHGTPEILILGTTNVSDGHVQPFIQIRCDAIRRVLTQIEFAPNRKFGDAALGRAMGRVLAHELYHVLLETTHHAASGLAKGILTVEELESDEFSFDKNDWDLRSATEK